MLGPEPCASIDSITCLPTVTRRCIAGSSQRPRSLLSEAHGVGHIEIAAAHPSLFGVVRPSPEQVRFVSFPACADVGVGHIAVITT